MGKALGIILAAIIIIGAGVYMMNRKDMDDAAENNTVTATQTQQQNVATGRTVFSVTDAAVGMSTISDINMEVNNVEVHSATSGWTTVSTTPRTYGLLSLNAKNESDLLADVRLPAGSYDQVRLKLTSVVVKTKAGATKVAKLPSSSLAIDTNLIVNADQTTSASFDFLADKSLFTADSGDYVFAPVVKTEAKSNADVTVNGDNSVIIIGGQSDASGTEGMDLDGSVKLNFQLKGTEKINSSTMNSLNATLNNALNSGATLDTETKVDAYGNVIH